MYPVNIAMWCFQHDENRIEYILMTITDQYKSIYILLRIYLYITWNIAIPAYYIICRVNNYIVRSYRDVIVVTNTATRGTNQV